jgi:hypothetical protein
VTTGDGLPIFSYSLAIPSLILRVPSNIRVSKLKAVYRFSHGGAPHHYKSILARVLSGIAA